MCGARDDDVVKAMLENKSLTLEKAVDVCRASEVARNTRTKLRDGAIAKVSAFKQQKSQTCEHFATRDVTRRCEQCGYRRHKDPMACPAIGASCWRCGVSGYFQSVCGRFDAFNTSDNSTERPTVKNVPMLTTLKTGERHPHRYERHIRQTVADIYTRIGFAPHATSVGDNGSSSWCYDSPLYARHWGRIYSYG